MFNSVNSRSDNYSQSEDSGCCCCFASNNVLKVPQALGLAAIIVSAVAILIILGTVGGAYIHAAIGLSTGMNIPVVLKALIITKWCAVALASGVTLLAAPRLIQVAIDKCQSEYKQGIISSDNENP